MKDAESLMPTARGLTQAQISELMHLSADLARLNYDRYRAFELPFTGRQAKQVRGARGHEAAPAVGAYYL